MILLHSDAAAHGDPLRVLFATPECVPMVKTGGLADVSSALPAALMADINNDGTPDAYWDNNLTLRRMDDNNRVDNPRYQRSWNWGGTIYWAVREGQGQIGWPGQ